MWEAYKKQFERHIKITPGCWFWKGNIITGGYGRFEIKGIYESAHRVSYLLYNGPIPKGLLIRHGCDVRNCVNPDHLQVGTQKENIQDAVQRGRMASGEQNGRSTISEETAIQLKDLAKCGLFTQKTIANWYGVKRSLIADIKGDRCWNTIG